MLIIAVAAAVVLLLLVVIALGCRRATGEHSPEYLSHLQSAAWRSAATATLDLTRRRCAVLPWRRAVHAHHLHYRNLSHEQPLRDLVPVSDLGHRIAHSWILWRGPGRWPMVAWLRWTTVTLAIWVRPWARYPLLAGMSVAAWWTYQELSACDWTSVREIFATVTSHIR